MDAVRRSMHLCSHGTFAASGENQKRLIGGKRSMAVSLSAFWDSMAGDIVSLLDGFRKEGRPPVPAYYNLGFVVLNEAALRIFRQEIFDVQSRLRKLVESNMRCQIAVTLISYAHQMRRQNLPAIFNAANDLRHFAHNSVRAEEIRIIHYLRKDEINRDSFLNDCERPAFLRATLRNPVNQLLQSVVRQLQNL